VKEAERAVYRKTRSMLLPTLIAYYQTNRFMEAGNTPPIWSFLHDDRAICIVVR
jgi:hypothetical protein